MVAKPAKSKQPRSFSVEQANASLPLVRAISADLSRLSRDLADRRQRLDLLTEGRDVTQGDPYSDELEQVRQELMNDDRRLNGFRQELRDLGVIARCGPEDCMDLVDFPARIDGRKVFLCWRLGEAEVTHWHEVDEGFESRRALATSICE